MAFYVELLVSFLLIGGAAFVFIGAVGLAKFPDFYTRLHAPTKATTLGVGAVLIGSMVYFSFIEGRVSVHEILIAGFLFITAPVGAHLLAKAARHLELPTVGDPPPDEE